MSRNPKFCPHNITDYDPDTHEMYCCECGDVIGTAESWADSEHARLEDEAIQDGTA